MHNNKNHNSEYNNDYGQMKQLCKTSQNYMNKNFWYACLLEGYGLYSRILNTTTHLILKVCNTLFKHSLFKFHQPCERKAESTGLWQPQLPYMPLDQKSQSGEIVGRLEHTTKNITEPDWSQDHDNQDQLAVCETLHVFDLPKCYCIPET